MSTIAACVCAVAIGTTIVRVQAAQKPADQKAPTGAPVVRGPQVQPPGDFVIGPDDVLGILFWRDEALSGDVVVRPDGKISIPLMNEIVVAGLTPEQLRVKLLEEAKRFVEEPNVTIVVRQINSRKVFVTGQVTRPNAYPLTSPTTVLQIIAIAGGLTEFADGKKITILRTESGKTVSLKFNYDDVRKGKKLEQNILLKAGDTVVVP
jgi:polysaccharide biosynthesis/export protein